MLLAAMVNAQEFVTYKEAKDPVKVSERSKAAWKEAKKMEAQWVSADSLYSRSEVPTKSGVAVRVLEGWKGERVSAQLLLWSDEYNVAYDRTARIWMVEFCTEGMDGGCQTVYMDEKGITLLIVYGE